MTSKHDLVYSIFRAYWCTDCYMVDGADWKSLDGNEWIDSNGAPATGERFEQATIHLVGGPRDGQTVG